MRSTAQQLEEHARHCLDVAFRCQDERVRRILRLLAIDLVMAAEEQGRIERLDAERSRPELETTPGQHIIVHTRKCLDSFRPCP